MVNENAPHIRLRDSGARAWFLARRKGRLGCKRPNYQWPNHAGNPARFRVLTDPILQRFSYPL